MSPRGARNAQTYSQWQVKRNSRVERDHLGYDRSQAARVRTFFRQPFGQHADQVRIELWDIISGVAIFGLRGHPLIPGAPRCW